MKGEIFINALENLLINVTNDKQKLEFQKPKTKSSDFKNYFNNYKKLEEKSVNNKFISNSRTVVNIEPEQKTTHLKINAEIKTEINKEDELKKLEEEMLLELSKIMGIPANEIKTKLEELDLMVFDLNKHENLIEFTKEIKQISSDLELLDKDIKNLIKDIKNIMDFKKDEIDKINEINKINIEDNIIKFKINNNQEDNNTNISLTENTTIENTTIENTTIENKILDIINQNENEEKPATNLEGQLIKVDINSEQIKTNNKFDQKSNQDLDQNFVTKNMHMINNNNSEINFQSVIKTEIIKPYVEPREVLNQIISNIKVDSSEKMSTIKMTLHPESLGDVTLKIATQNGIVTAQFVAENERVKAIIEAGFNNLKDILSEQGVNINSLSVSVGGDEQSNKGSSFNQNQNTRHDISIEGFMETSEVVSKYDINDSETTVNYMV